ncbi:MAG: hypothetical protein K0R65_1953 [Crocinitomicaceae bacterium]|jgi:hypothetical protein|nr:hypothetical protein [Crocinitomicaceae bacterium]
MQWEDEHEDNGRSDDFNRVKNMPLTRKASEIMDLVIRICDVIHHHDYEESHILQESCNYMKSNAMLIQAKIHGAEAVDLYDLKMENAAIIRKAALDIVQDCRTLQIYGFDEEDYLDLVRTDVEDFRLMFLEWVANFDHYTIKGDEWGLFNPPGYEPGKNQDDDY